MISSIRVFKLVALCAVVAGCHALPSGGPKAVAELQATRGHQTTGTASFTQMGDLVQISVVVTGLTPNQEHGFHIHEVGDCSSGDGMGTKGHFNPMGKPHGHQGHSERHAGDMPNLKADANGRAEAKFMLDGVTLSEGRTSIIGRGVIVHAQPDDYKSQPVGNSGARIACGAIRKA